MGGFLEQENATSMNAYNVDLKTQLLAFVNQ
jgi:hypothetical protein